VKIIFLFTVLAIGTVTYAQRAVTHVYLSSGGMRALANDVAITPFTIRDNSPFLNVGISRQKKLRRLELQYTNSSFTLKSSVPNTPTVFGFFNSLQFSWQRELVTKGKTTVRLGPALSARAFVREINSISAGELMQSLDVAVSASRQLTRSGRGEVSFNIPLVTGVGHRTYVLSGQDVRVASWGRFQSLQVQVAYVMTLNTRADFALGYELLYYGYDFNEPVRVLTQKFQLGIRLKFPKDESVEK
jgi:hypothetical protein